MRFSQAAAVLAATASFATAQTSTDCDPTKKTCPADTGLNAAAFAADFTQGSSANASFSAAAYTFINYGSQGAEFIIAKEGQAPTVQTDFYVFFGIISVKMRAAPGTGIVSSIVLESDDLDEIDWEFLGGNTAQVETNFFGKGDTSSYDRAIYYPVSSPQDQFHTYTVDWTAERILWIVDGVTVRTLAYNDPLTKGGKLYPQTPMRLKLGNWCGGCKGIPEGTVEWAGGNTTFDDAPYTMYVESVEIQNNNPADSYEYGDLSGSWQSIKINKTDGSSSTPIGTNSTVSATGSAISTSTGGVYLQGNGTLVAAPTSSASVAGIDQQSRAAVSVTQTGSSYSVNTASVSAQNDGSTATDSGSVASVTTEVPGTSPTGDAVSGSDSGSDSSSRTGTATAGGTSSTSSGPAAQTGTNAASVNNVLTAGSLLSVALGFFML
ncbi:hypothetical protein LTR15_012822 [Elasticomyces elasticus]|nr:hypothetical protein LTR15_012822 [Elasticomyces elasticus]